MKKILLTNNSIFIDKKYFKVYTDSPYVVEKYDKIPYMNTLIEWIQEYRYYVEGIK